MADREIVPQLWVIGYEVTEFLSPELTEKTGRVVYMGLWDSAEMTFLCSLTPSGFVRFWYNGFFTEKGIDDDTYEEMTGSVPDDCYLDYGGLARINGKVLYPGNIGIEAWQRMVDKDHDGDAEAAYEELIDQAIEYLWGNTMECTVAAAMGFEFDFEQGDDGVHAPDKAPRRTPAMFLTLEYLEQTSACQEAREWFAVVYPDGVYVTREELKKCPQPSWVWWLACQVKPQLAHEAVSLTYAYSSGRTEKWDELKKLAIDTIMEVGL